MAVHGSLRLPVEPLATLLSTCPSGPRPCLTRAPARRVDVNTDRKISAKELQRWIMEKTAEHFQEAIQESRVHFRAVDPDGDGAAPTLTLTLTVQTGGGGSREGPRWCCREDAGQGANHLASWTCGPGGHLHQGF